MEERRTYLCNDDVYVINEASHTRDSLTIYCGPSASSDLAQRVSISPGSTFTVSAAWRPSIYDVKEDSILFVKLLVEKAWVAVRSTSSSSVSLLHVEWLIHRWFKSSQFRRESVLTCKRGSSHHLSAASGLISLSHHYTASIFQDVVYLCPSLITTVTYSAILYSIKLNATTWIRLDLLYNFQFRN